MTVPRPAAFLLAALLSGCGGPISAAQAPAPVDVEWEFGFSADPRWVWAVNSEFGLVAYPSIAAMTDAADFVAVGHFVPTGETHRVQGDAAEDVYVEPVGSFHVDELLAGAAPPAKARMTLPWNLGPERIPQDRVLLFAHWRDDGTQAYRVLDKFGFFAATARAALDTPIGEESPAGLSPFGGELRRNGLDDLDGLIAYVRDGKSSGGKGIG